MTDTFEVLRVPNQIGDASNRVFPFKPLKIFDETQLEVYLVNSSGVPTLLNKGTSTTTYSVTVEEFPGTGFITYPADSTGTAVAADEYISIKLNLPLIQGQTLERRGGYDPAVHEGIYDRLVGMIKQVYEEVVRSPRLYINDADDLASDRIPMERTADRYLRWNSTKSILEAVVIATTTGSASDTSPVALGSASAGTNAPYSRDDHVHPTTGLATLAGENVFTESQVWAKGLDFASAAALAFTAGNIFDVTGTTTVTSITSIGVGTVLVLHFDGALTFTHNATDLICPGGRDIVTHAGMEITLYEYASGDWRVIAVQDDVPVNLKQTLDLTRKATLFEDFISDVKTPIDSTVGGGNNNAALTMINGVGGQATMLTADDDTTQAANTTAFSFENLDWQADQGGLIMEGRLKISDVSEAALFFGFSDTITTTVVELPIYKASGTDNIDSDATDACGIGYDVDGTTDEWFHGGVDSGTDTAATHSGSSPSDNTFVTLRVEVSAAGAVEGFVDGVSIGTATASAITPGTAITPYVAISNRSANQVTLTMDYVYVQGNRA